MDIESFINIHRYTVCTSDVFPVLPLVNVSLLGDISVVGHFNETASCLTNMCFVFNIINCLQNGCQ